MQKKTYFEGWYFKHQNLNSTVCIIPAIHKSRNGTASASIQVISDTVSEMIPFSEQEVKIYREPLSIIIGNCFFSKTGIDINIERKDFYAVGKILYQNSIPLKYDVMGPFRLIPFLQCNHGVISMRHQLNGFLHLNEKKYDFNGGIGYIEKDWGSSFPDSYVWTQCNDFDEENCSVMVSVADIPLGIRKFTGFICCIYYKEKEYRLATYCGGKVIQKDRSQIHIQQGTSTLLVELISETPKPLFAPVNGILSRTVQESIACTVRYRFSIGKQVVFDLTSNHAGYEFAEKEDGNANI
jgi:hypothetical protein